MGQAELRAIGFGLLFLLFSAFFISVVQLITNGRWHITLFFSIVFLIANGIWVFNPRRIIAIAGVGELAELFHFTPSMKGLPPNTASKMYWQLTGGVFSLISCYFLLIPFLPLREWWLAAIVFPFLLIAAGLFLGALGGILFFRLMTAVAFVMLTYVFISAIFPQVEYYFRFKEKLNKTISSPVAKLALDTDKLRIEQRQKLEKIARAKAYKWQEENPGRDLPEELTREIEAAKQGLSLKELNEKLEAEKVAKQAAAENKKMADEAIEKAKKAAELAVITAKAKADEAEAEARRIKAEAEAEKIRQKEEFKKRHALIGVKYELQEVPCEIPGWRKFIFQHGLLKNGDRIKFSSKIAKIYDNGGSWQINGYVISVSGVKSDMKERSGYFIIKFLDDNVTHLYIERIT